LLDGRLDLFLGLPVLAPAHVTVPAIDPHQMLARGRDVGGQRRQPVLSARCILAR
jgi:hypothetical protein